MDSQWQEVRYGRRRRAPQLREPLRERQDRWVDRAFHTPPLRRGNVHKPNRPAPPPRLPYRGDRRRSDDVTMRQARRREPEPRDQRWRPVRHEEEEEDDVIPRRAADVGLRNQIKVMYKIIKVVHHLENVSPESDKAEPKMISAIVQHLTTVIRPAGPTPNVSQMIWGNAKNWGYNTLTILADHYRDALAGALEELDKVLRVDWSTAFEVAIRWAKRSLPRLTSDTVDQAEAIIIAQMMEEEEDEGDGAEMRQEVITQPSKKTTSIRQTTREKRPQRVVRLDQRIHSPQRPVSEANLFADLMGRSDDEDLPPRQQPKDQRPRRENKKIKARTSREEKQTPTREEDGDLIEWVRAQESPVQERSLRSSQLVDLFELEEEEDNGEPQLPVATSSPQTPIQEPLTPERHQVQVHRAAEDDDEDASPEETTETGEGRFGPRRHQNTMRKFSDWKLTVERKWLVIGDSNVSNLPQHTCEDLQMESFPGGQFRHAQRLMEEAVTPQNLTVEKIILSFGINSRANKPKETTIKNMQAAIRSTKNQFPHAEIYVPVLNFSENLPAEEKHNLCMLNEFIRKNVTFIPPLPSHLFHTVDDNLHWSEETGEEMLRLWWKELNWPSL